MKDAYDLKWRDLWIIVAKKSKVILQEAKNTNHKGALFNKISINQNGDSLTSLLNSIHTTYIYLIKNGIVLILLQIFSLFVPMLKD